MTCRFSPHHRGCHIPSSRMMHVFYSLHFHRSRSFMIFKVYMECLPTQTKPRLFSHAKEKPPLSNRDAAAVTEAVVCWLVGCLTSQQQASVSQGRICTDNFTCCHTEIEAADQTFHLTQSQYTDTGPTSPSGDPITPGAWQGSHWSANF